MLCGAWQSVYDTSPPSPIQHIPNLLHRVASSALAAANREMQFKLSLITWWLVEVV